MTGRARIGLRPWGGLITSCARRALIAGPTEGIVCDARSTPKVSSPCEHGLPGSSRMGLREDAKPIMPTGRVAGRSSWPSLLVLAV